MNCIKIIKVKEDEGITKRDLLSALLVHLGATVSNMPRNLSGHQETYSDNCELFDPRKVTKSDILPDYWKMVYDMHNKPDMGDCRYFRYRYVHIPYEIIPQYPRVPCKGIFCLDSKKVRSNNIKTSNLVFIGNNLS